MSFTITKDLIFDPEIDKKSVVGVVGPRGTKFTAKEIENHPDRQEFRMLDDDENVYYHGLFVPDNTDEFQPLDCFGTPNAGATEIQYLVNGVWKTL